MSNHTHIHSERCSFNRPSEIAPDLQGNFIIGCLSGEKFRLSRSGVFSRENNTEGSHFNKPIFEGSQIVDGAVIKVSSYTPGETTVETASKELVFELQGHLKGFSYAKSDETMHFLVDNTIKSCPWADLEGPSEADSWVSTPLKNLDVSAIAVSGPSRFVGISRLTGGLVEIQQISGEVREVLPFGRPEEGGVRNLVSLVSDGYGNWAVIDRDNYRVVHQLTDGAIGFYGSKGSGAGELDWSGAAAMLDSATVLVADTNNDRLIRVNLANQSATVIAIREECPDRLSRPVSISRGAEVISICERGNGRITTVLRGGKIQYGQVFLNHGEQLSSFILSSSGNGGMGMLLGRARGYGFLRQINLHSGATIRSFEGPLADPQGMVLCPNSEVVVADTLNRRALLVNNRLELVHEWDLASISGNPRFLCRVPSVVRGIVYCPDYETGVTICINPRTKEANLIEIKLSTIGLTALRKLVEWGSNTVLMGRGETPIVVLSSGSRPMQSQKLKSTLDCASVPVDGLDIGRDLFLFLDKEKDRMGLIHLGDFVLREGAECSIVTSPGL